jgi:hypothetical protein
MVEILTLSKGVGAYLAAVDRIYCRRSRPASRRAQSHRVTTAACWATSVSAPVTT